MAVLWLLFKEAFTAAEKPIPRLLSLAVGRPKQALEVCDKLYLAKLILLVRQTPSFQTTVPLHGKSLIMKISLPRVINLVGVSVF